ncbi:hypothetical protein [Raineyella fluvialis]|uniref:Uncharacterized protein n=1 Tax=Raineyella fluvialis TaxID=2662261 RepID=A0A5Q2FB96_9ACTN|nr:hypothetical protein [Raineyella fluvialis]QGF24152.1 hypothetical protein Rai3103_11235 [Raineyella fluvialis]
MADLPAPGRRIALRWHDEDGPRELIGYVQGAEPQGLAILDRTLAVRLLPWSALESWRAVPQVPRGRDPLRADRALLDRMASDPRLTPDSARPEGGGSDVCQVARLCDLLGPGIPDQPPAAYDTGNGTAAADLGTAEGRAIVVGEWATVRLSDGDRADEVVAALARWAAYRDARTIQVRGIDRPLAGFTVLAQP